MPSNASEYSRLYYLQNKEKLRKQYQSKTSDSVVCEECGKMVKTFYFNQHLQSAYHARHKGSGVFVPTGSMDKDKARADIEELTKQAQVDASEASRLKEEIGELVRKMNLLNESVRVSLQQAKDLEKFL